MVSRDDDLLIRKCSSDFYLPAVVPDDQIIESDDSDWYTDFDLQHLRDEFDTLPFAALEPTAFDSLWAEMENIMRGGRIVRGFWPARIILATRK